MTRPIRLLINSAAMTHNLGRVRDLLRQTCSDAAEHTNQTPVAADARSATSVLSRSDASNLPQAVPRVWAVIKADAYGHGIETAVSAFSAADGLAMLDFEEAIRSRNAGWTKPILMLEGVFDQDDLQICEQYDLCPVVHEQGQINMIRARRFGRPVNVYLKLDTGMHRLGFAPEQYRQAFEALVALQGAGKIASIGHMTHFACADEPDGIDAPLAIFNEMVDGLPGSRCVANSAAVLAHTRKIVRADRTDSLHVSTAGARSQQGVVGVAGVAGLMDSARFEERWVRPGICLYGASPLADRPANQLGLRASMTLVSRVLSVRVVRAGEGIGYSYLYRAPQDMRVAVVACGYADGYPRHAPSGTPIVVNGQRATLAGRVSMDMLTVDVSNLPRVDVGDEVILWGEGGPAIDEVAQASETIGYELLTAVTPRVPRVFV